MKYERKRTTHQTQFEARQQAAGAMLMTNVGMVEVWHTTAAALFFLDGDDPTADETVWVCDVYTPYTDATMSYEVVGSLVHNRATVDPERGIPTDDEDAPEQNMPLPGALALEAALKVKRLNDPFGFGDEG